MILAKCHSIKSRFTFNILQEEMINKVLGPGAPDERITNGYEIVLRQDVWILNCKWLNDQILGLGGINNTFLQYTLIINTKILTKCRVS